MAHQSVVPPVHFSKEEKEKIILLSMLPNGDFKYLTFLNLVEKAIKEKGKKDK